MINNYNLIDLSEIILISILCGFLVFIMSVTAKQNWAKNNYMYVTFLALPSIGSVITKVISGDIALSLGMVGALSIIRFRTPIKNPLELVVYFLLLTIGIANTVNPFYGIILTFTFGTILIFVKLTSRMLLKNSISNSITYHDKIIISIQSKEKIEKIENSFNIKEIVKQNGHYNYILEFHEISVAKGFLIEIESEYKNIEYTLNY